MERSPNGVTRENRYPVIKSQYKIVLEGFPYDLDNSLLSLIWWFLDVLSRPYIIGLGPNIHTLR